MGTALPPGRTGERIQHVPVHLIERSSPMFCSAFHGSLLSHLHRNPFPAFPKWEYSSDVAEAAVLTACSSSFTQWHQPLCSRTASQCRELI